MFAKLKVGSSAQEEMELKEMFAPYAATAVVLVPKNAMMEICSAEMAVLLVVALNQGFYAYLMHRAPMYAPRFAGTVEEFRESHVMTATPSMVTDARVCAQLKQV